MARDKGRGGRSGADNDDSEDPEQEEESEENAAPEVSAADLAVTQLVYDQLGVTEEATKQTGWCREIVRLVIAGMPKNATPDQIKALAQRHYERKSVEDHGEASPFHEKSA